MGTRADFYVGIDENAEWLGSIAYDGYPSGIPSIILESTSEEQFRRKVNEFINAEDGVNATNGEKWPWPWNDSRTTDYAYAFFEGEVFGNGFGKGWFSITEYFLESNLDENFDEDSLIMFPSNFPDMSNIKEVNIEKSGLLFFSSMPSTTEE